jgi:uncharacterized protein (TIGR04255 family)
VDPAYPLLVGVLFEQVKADYPVIEELPASAMPDQITPYIVKYRFRPTPNGWPCVQIGPGVASINFTTGYDWPKFRDAALAFIAKVVAAYTSTGNRLVPTSVLLRYINAVAFDATREDALDFLKNRLNVQVALPDAIRRHENASGPPDAIVFRAGFPLTRPKAVASVQLGTGTHNNAPAFVWDLAVASTNGAAPSITEGFSEWLDQAHEVAEAWFFSLIEGRLMETFNASRT